MTHAMWGLFYYDGGESDTLDHVYTSEARAEQARIAAISDSVAQREKELSRAREEIESGHPPWWWGPQYQKDYPDFKRWAEHEFAKASERALRSWHVEIVEVD